LESLQTRRGDFSPAVGEKSLLGRPESATRFASLHSIQGALSATLLHGFGRFMLSNERPAPVRCCNAS